MSLEEAQQYFAEAKQETTVWFQKEISTLRTGRVRSELVESLPVEHYGTRTPLNGLASITNSDARTLVITPWDPSAIPSIQRALTEAALGVQPIVDGKIIRLAFPSLTEEAREHTVKTLHKKVEEARVRLRQGRDEALQTLKADKQRSDITEDDFYDGKKELDTFIDQANEEIAELARKKEEEIHAL